MAGYYPDVPDHKIFYHDDGSIAFTQPTTGGAITAISTQNTNDLVSEWDNGGNGYMNATNRLGVLFPQAMDIVGIYALHTDGVNDSNGVVRTSADTTNGADGTWTTVTSSLAMFNWSDPLVTTLWRSAIQPISISGARGITASGNSGGQFAQCVSFHLYGRPSVGAKPDRLRFWHPTTDTEVLGPHFDYGDLPQGQISTKQFRIKNNSTTKTASNITIAADALWAPNPTLSSQTSFSANGTTFTPTLGIGNLTPGALSSVLDARLALMAYAQVGPWRQRYKATASTWA